MNKEKVVFLFSGQGSQYKYMGRDLYESNAAFRASMQRSDAIIERVLQRSLIAELYEPKTEKFDDILITHPAIVAVEIASFEALMHIGIEPDYVCGHSLGEFAAATASGIWEAETALSMAIEQAKALARSDLSGGMLALIDPEQIVSSYEYKQHGLFLAADNFHGHRTLAGSSDNIDSFQSAFNDPRITIYRLPVNVPFHTPLVQQCLKDLVFLSQDTLFISKPDIPFLSGLLGETLTSITIDYFNRVVSEFYHFPSAISYLESLGPCCYIDLGPSGSSATLAKYNLSEFSSSRTFEVMTPFKNKTIALDRLKEAVLSF